MTDICDEARKAFAAFNGLGKDIINRLIAELEAERCEREKLSKGMRSKDEAMGVLFQRLAAANVDCSDLIP